MITQSDLISVRFDCRPQSAKLRIRDKRDPQLAAMGGTAFDASAAG
jgi:hypothetical protein